MTVDYNFDIENKMIYSKISDQAMLQRWIQRALLIERNMYPQYTPNFGIEWEVIKNNPFPLVRSLLEKSIKECITIRPEIKGITDFSAEISETQSNVVNVQFTVHTIYGSSKQQAKVKL